MLDPDEILAKIRTLAAEAKAMKNPASFRPLVSQDFMPDVQILTFDQTLTNAGWALLNTDDGRISVPDSGTIRPVPTGAGLKGFEVTFTKSVCLARDLRTLLTRLYGQFEDVVLELPSVFGYRTESSLVAAVTICITLDEMGLNQPAFISRQSAGALLTGDRNASKSRSSEVVKELVGDNRPTGPGQWTEHVRDAAFIGLRHLYQEGV